MTKRVYFDGNEVRASEKIEVGEPVHFQRSAPDEGEEMWKGNVVLKGEAVKLERDWIQHGEAVVREKRRVDPMSVKAVVPDPLSKKAFLDWIFQGDRAADELPVIPRKRRGWWPRGKYNGRRIVGFSVRISIDVTDWRWLPYIRWQWHLKCCHWLCVRSWIEKNYAEL